MARRSDHSREELYDLILTRAQQLVEAQGFRALSARRIADGVGYSPGTLYNYFKNLDDLIIHLNTRTLTLLDQTLERTHLAGEPETDALALAFAYFSFVEDHPRLWELLFEYRLGDDTELPDWFTHTISHILSRLADVLAPLFAPSESQRLDEAVLVLWTSLHGIGSLATSGKLAIVTERATADLTRSLIVNYVRGLKVAGERL